MYNTQDEYVKSIIYLYFFVKKKIGIKNKFEIKVDEYVKAKLYIMLKPSKMNV